MESQEKIEKLIRVVNINGQLIIGNFIQPILREGAQTTEYFSVIDPLSLMIFKDEKDGIVKLSMIPIPAISMENNEIELNLSAASYTYDATPEIISIYEKTLEKLKNMEIKTKAEKQGIVTDLNGFRSRNPKDIA